ncbi:MAG: TolC family protein [Rickettsiales bacterium]|jgi:outer membrane protein TolC|nr:TolC family protein [Rickettsiales bacterium]
MLKKFMLFLAVGIYALCAGTAAHAIDLSFDDAVAKIAAENWDLKKAELNVTRAAAAVDSVNANRWFRADATASYTNTINVENPGKQPTLVVPPGIIEGFAGMSVPIPDNMLMAGVSITQPIYTFGRVGNALDAARTAVKMAELGHTLARAEIRAAAAQIYWTAAAADEMVKIARASHNSAINAKRTLENGARANRANLVKISADVETRAVALADAEFNRDSAYRMLRVMAGLADDEPITLTTSIPSEFSALVAAPKKLESTPEWDMLEHQAKMFESRARAARAGRMPTLAATAAYNYVAMANDYNVFARAGSQSANIGLALSVPIFDGGLSRATATLDAMDAESARQDLEKSKKMRGNEWAEANLKREHLISQLKHMKSAKILTDKAYGISADRFAAGQTSAVELAEVWAGVAQMDMAILDAKFKILMANETIKKLNAGSASI